MRSSGTPIVGGERARRGGLFTMTARIQASAARSLFRRRRSLLRVAPVSSASGWCTIAISGWVSRRLRAASGSTPKASPSITIGRPFGTSARCALAAARVSAFGWGKPRRGRKPPAASRVRATPRSCACHRHSRRSGYRGRRDREDEIALHHKGASYQARAFGDLPTVTRIAEISRGVAAELACLHGGGERSNTQRVRHSVVVLRP